MGMKPVQVFHVIPSLPAALEGLRRLAYNLRWAWDHNTIELFRRLDSDLWESTEHNPVLMLGSIDQAELEAAAKDEAFLAHLERTLQQLDGYLTNPCTWFQRAHDHQGPMLVAYFSAEFGLTECLSVFAGGLGVLAGDHLKGASGLGVLAGVQKLQKGGHRAEAFFQLDEQLRRGNEGRIQRGEQQVLLEPQQVCRRMIGAEALRHARKLLALHRAEQPLGGARSRQAPELRVPFRDVRAHRQQR